MPTVTYRREPDRPPEDFIGAGKMGLPWRATSRGLALERGVWRPT